MLKVYDFWAEWCGPCKAMTPLIESLSSEYNVEESGVEVVKVNVDDDLSGLVKQYGVRTIPTLVFVKDGAEVDRISGNKSRQDLVELINKHTS